MQPWYNYQIVSKWSIFICLAALEMSSGRTGDTWVLAKQDLEVHVAESITDCWKE